MSQNEYPHDPFGSRPATDPDQSAPQSSGAEQPASQPAPGTGQAPGSRPAAAPEGAAASSPYAAPQSPYGAPSSAGTGSPYGAPSPYQAPAADGAASAGPAPSGQQPGAQHQPYGAGQPGAGQAPYGAPQGGPQGYTGDAHPSAAPLPPGFSGAFEGPLSGQPVSPSDSRMWSMFAQLSAVLGYVIGAGFLGWVGPLIIFLVYKDRDRYVRYNAAESLNAAIATVIAEVVLTIVITILAVVTLGIGSILVPLVWVPALLHVIFAIIGAVKANQGIWWNYPLNIRLVK